MTAHIEAKKSDIAKTVIMPGDPKRAKYIAEKYLTDVKVVNEVRNMTAYTGKYKEVEITIFPSGMGIPSMGIYSYELFKEYNVDNIIRIGSCGGYDSDLKLKDVILVSNSYSESTYAKCLDNYAKKHVESNKFLNDLILKTAYENNIKLNFGNIYCSDVFYEKEYDYKKRAKDLNVVGIEMETFALFNNARKLNKKAAALLSVSDLFFSDSQLSSKEREIGFENMFKLALESCLKL